MKGHHLVARHRVVGEIVALQVARHRVVSDEVDEVVMVEVGETKKFLEKTVKKCYSITHITQWKHDSKNY